ncbi:hypothetical protein ACQ4PT_070948 [Festuca glaucescens]
MSGSLVEKDPCPDRILDDAGGAFGMGLVGGSAWHFFKALRNSPNGARIIGGMQAARMNGLRVGGSFAVWYTLYSTFDCTSVYVRQKEDPWNSIIAGASASGFLSLRHGLRAAGGSAIGGGIFLAGIEGFGIIINRFLAMPQNLPQLPANDPNLAATIAAGGGGLPQAAVVPPEVGNSSGGGSWLRSLFGREEKKKPSGSGGKSEILENFETPSPPIPSFDYK